MIINNGIVLVGIICIRFSYGLPLLFIGRFMTGYTNGANRSCVPPYTSEICQPSIRKSTGTFVVLFYITGYALFYVLGVAFAWRDLLSIITIFPCISILLLYFCPKSPTWLMNKGMINEAKDAMIKLRGNEKIAELEIKRLENNIKEQKVCQMQARNKSYLYTLWTSFKQGTFVRPFGVLLILMTIGMHWTGAPPISFYLVPVLQKSKIPMGPYLAAAVLSCYRLLATIIGTILATFVPRRPLYISCFLVASTGSLLFGTSAYLNLFEWYQSFQEDYPFARWFPMLAIFLMYTGFSGGIGPVTFALFGELLPANLRALGTGLISAIGCISLFCSTKFIPNFEASMGPYGMFWLFSVFGYSMAIFAYLCIPETFGLTLEDIEAHYRKVCYLTTAQIPVEASNINSTRKDEDTQSTNFSKHVTNEECQPFNKVDSYRSNKT